MSHLVGLHAIDGNHELSASPFDSYHQLKSTAEISSRPVSSFFCESTLQQYFAAPNRGVCSSAYLPKGKHFLKKRFFFSQSTTFSKHAAKKLVNANIALMAAPV